MNVVTLDPALLKEACSMLADSICTSLGGKTPDAVIGIRTGGEKIADNIAQSLSVKDVAYTSTSRPGKTLRSMLSPMLRILPHSVTNILRSIEGYLLQMKPARERKIYLDIPADIARRLACHLSPTILIVDDAVNSGKTMSDTIKAISRVFPAAKIISATITVTTSSPIVRPDFSLYNMCLVRFPWSSDYRGK